MPIKIWRQLNKRSSEQISGYLDVVVIEQYYNIHHRVLSLTFNIPRVSDAYHLPEQTFAKLDHRCWSHYWAVFHGSSHRWWPYLWTVCLWMLFRSPLVNVGPNSGYPPLKSCHRDLLHQSHLNVGHTDRLCFRGSEHLQGLTDLGLVFTIS